MEGLGEDDKVTDEDDDENEDLENTRDPRPRQRKEDKEDEENDNIRITLYDPHHPQSFRHLGTYHLFIFARLSAV